MKKFILVLLLLLFFVNSSKWAILIAGSNTWFNYRHQADVFHAYQVLLAHNFQPDHIITFAYNDIAKDPRNPFPGKVFNKPTYQNPGVDVYNGVKIDYSGTSVTPQIFLNVLQGNRSAVAGKGTGKVLQSTSQDNVFMFFSDHGAPGLIAFPSQYLYADQLLQTFAKINGKYKKFVFYLQTCQSGSMFTKLPTNTKIYALSAANPTQSSYGTYCSPDDVVQAKHIGTCLGDLFSVNFIEDSQISDISSQTLQQQFQKVKVATDLSHVMKWGEQTFLTDKVSQYIGGVSKNQKSDISNLRKKIIPIKNIFQRNSASIDSRFMKIKILSQIYTRERTEQSYNELRQEMISMQRFDSIFSKFALNLKLNGFYNPQSINFECLREVMNFQEKTCGRLTDYGLIYVKYFAQACQKYPVNKIIQSLDC